MRRILFALLAVLTVALTAGCGGDKQDTYGNKAEDWKKSTPPPNYKGPGQPGAPGAAPK